MIQLEPLLQKRVWGGQRLQAGHGPIGEAWVVFDGNPILQGPHRGKTLGELVHEQPLWLLGSTGQHFQTFPLLIKLLDCQDWLSVQVHPNDEQAVALHGPGHQGKTEAWHVLHAEPGAQVIAGVKADICAETLREHILQGKVAELCQWQGVQTGDTLFMPAGTLHALGPGLFIYEVQQTSDLTYRIYDWDRPATAGRQLHLQASAQVTRADFTGVHTPAPDLQGTGTHALVECPYFKTELLHLESPLEEATTGETFHILTVTEGTVQIQGDSSLHLSPLQTVLVPASPTPYRLVPLEGPARVIRSSLC